MTDPHDRAPLPSSPRVAAGADPIDAAAEAMRQAAASLAQIVDASPTAPPPPLPSPPTASPEDVARQRYHELLERRGELIDVDERTDLRSLPPATTHVRFPDGHVRRIAYS